MRSSDVSCNHFPAWLFVNLKIRWDRCPAWESIWPTSTKSEIRGEIKDHISLPMSFFFFFWIGLARICTYRLIRKVSWYYEVSAWLSKTGNFSIMRFHRPLEPMNMVQGATVCTRIALLLIMSTYLPAKTYPSLSFTMPKSLSMSVLLGNSWSLEKLIYSLQLPFSWRWVLPPFLFSGMGRPRQIIAVSSFCHAPLYAAWLICRFEYQCKQLFVPFSPVKFVQTILSALQMQKVLQVCVSFLHVFFFGSSTVHANILGSTHFLFSSSREPWWGYCPKQGWRHDKIIQKYPLYKHVRLWRNLFFRKPKPIQSMSIFSAVFRLGQIYGDERMLA